MNYDYVSSVTSMDLPMDWENVFEKDERTKEIKAESISDGLILSLTNLGKVDIEYISAVTGEDYKTVISELKGSIYQNPEVWAECFFHGWETKEEYLSGNLMHKLRVAEEANEIYNGYFEENVEILKAYLPPVISEKDIFVTIGSPWIPTDVIDDFIVEVFGDWTRGWRIRGNGWLHFRTRHNEITGSWEIPNKGRYVYYNTNNSQVYGTQEMNALTILEKTLNMKRVYATDEEYCPTNKTGKKRVINQEKTMVLLEKQRLMIETFQDWVWRDAKRKKRLQTIFEEKYGCLKQRVFDGSFLQFPGMNPLVKLYPYQKNAVARILFSDNVLLAHDVGSGKTYIMITSAMESRRMGIAKKNLFVVPNNIVGQWEDIFKFLYPDAKILCIDPKNFKPDKRDEMLHRIRDEEYDGIIMAYSCFEQIHLSKAYYKSKLEEEQTALNKIVRIYSGATSKTVRQYENVRKALDDLDAAIEEAEFEIYFDELGITNLYVDEAHNFKNVPIDTKIKGVLGISNAGSKKCRDMLDKVRVVQKNNNGKGVVMATGTPITNSITDIYVMQQYLQPGELALMDIQHFDSWVGMFAERTTDFEIDVDTSGYRLATRFANFHNIPELTTILSSVADFHQLDITDGIPVMEGYELAQVPKSLELKGYLEEISERADQVRHRRVSLKDDNMLKITGDGRKAALDMRLIDISYSDSPDSKVRKCVDNILTVYRDTFDICGTQLVFCDVSTPKKDFNMYDELKRLLLLHHIPEETIAFVHDAMTEVQRRALFSKVNSGDIRILIGSTFKLGMGVNVQTRLAAIHHLDVPWRPSDMTQREGRILRQGNINETVRIFRYITEGSFDAYSWQLLETKQKFITDLLSGSIDRRDSGDVEDTVLDYAEVKALAIGNPLIKKRVEVCNRLTQYKILQKNLVEKRVFAEKTLQELPDKIKEATSQLADCEGDFAFCEKWMEEHREYEGIDFNKSEEETVEREEIRKQLHKALLNNILQTQETRLFDYRGFNIVLPMSMTYDRAFIYLVRNGRYKLDMGNSDHGNLRRIDYFLDHFEAQVNKKQENLDKMLVKQDELQRGLDSDESYTDIIAELTDELKQLDDKLGIKSA